MLRRHRCAALAQAYIDFMADFNAAWVRWATPGVLEGYSRGTPGVLQGYSRVLQGYSRGSRASLFGYSTGPAARMR
jgi:hypothetical protein